MTSNRSHMNRTRLLYVIPLVLSLNGSAVLGGCSAFEPGQASVPDSTLVEILVDLHIAGARERLGYEGPDGIRDSILVQHGVDEEAFRASLDYYVEDSRAYVILYREVLDRIVAEQSRMGEQLRRQWKPDSTVSAIAE